MVAAKLRLRETAMEDDADINPHRHQTTRSIRGGGRYIQGINRDDTFSIRNKGNMIQTKGQQYSELERQGSNIFVHKGTW